MARYRSMTVRAIKACCNQQYTAHISSRHDTVDLISQIRYFGIMNIPSDLLACLSTYQVVMTDAASGEPIAWGHNVVKTIDPDKWELLKQYGILEVVERGFSNKWALILKTLTRAEAVAKYGKITCEERGPRGGFRSVTFGQTSFISKYLK